MPTDTETEAIMSHLLDYADENDFRLLAARDYGSRARGLESDSSDYDVFFVFAQPPADYAIGSDTETYTKEIPPEESLLDTEIELHGWNLQRFIGNDGLCGSNPTAMEFCISDEQYFMSDTAESYFEVMIDHSIDQFKPYALINHYRSLAASNFGKYIEGDYKLTSDTSYDDLLTYGDPPWGGIAEDAANHLHINESETVIGTDQIDLNGKIEWSLSCGTIDIDRALELDLVEPTTLDRTNKRYLNITQALLKSRYIEETHKCPPIEASELLRWAAGSEWLSTGAYARIGTLIAGKKTSGAIDTGTIPPLDAWIRDELDRTLAIEPHVQRQPDTEHIRSTARNLYNSLDWYGI